MVPIRKLPGNGEQMDINANKIVIVTQKSRLQELLYKYNTKAQAKFYIEHMGAGFSDYILEDETYQKALANVKQIADKLAVNDFLSVQNLIHQHDMT